MNPLCHFGPICWATISIAIGSCSGCVNDSGKLPTKAKPLSKEQLASLSMDVGFALPHDVEILEATDGGGRGAPAGYYIWVVFSPTKFDMPKMLQPDGTYEYLQADDVSTNVNAIEVHISPRKIIHPREGYWNRWEAGKYEFRGSLVRSKEGEYLEIERFRK